MTEKKARVLSLAFGLFFYILLVYLAVTNCPISSIRNNYFIGPVMGVIISIFIISFSRRGESTLSNESILGFKMWMLIFFPVALGVFALVDLSIKGSYSEIDWVIYPIVLSIGLNGWELIRGRNEKVQ